MGDGGLQGDDGEEGDSGDVGDRGTRGRGGDKGMQGPPGNEVCFTDIQCPSLHTQFVQFDHFVNKW